MIKGWAGTFCKFRIVGRKLWCPAEKRIHQNKLERTRRMKSHIWGRSHQGQNWMLNSAEYYLSGYYLSEYYLSGYYLLQILNSSGIFCRRSDLTRLGWSKLDHQGQAAVWEKFGRCGKSKTFSQKKMWKSKLFSQTVFLFRTILLEIVSYM